MNRRRVLLGDDHVLVAEALARLLEDEFELVGLVHDGGALLQAARDLRPDVVVADLSMPVLSGFEVLRRLKREGASVKIVVLTAHDEPELAAVALRDGADGYVLKHSAGEDLIKAIHEVMRGRVYVSPRAEGR